DPPGETRNLSRTGIFVDHPLRHPPHNLGFRGLQSGPGGDGVTRGQSLLHLANKAAQPGLARVVDGGALPRCADTFLGGGNIWHRAIPGWSEARLLARPYWGVNGEDTVHPSVLSPSDQRIWVCVSH